MKFATTLNEILRLAKSRKAEERMTLLSISELEAVFGGSGGGGANYSSADGGTGGSGGNPGGLDFRPDQHIGEVRIVEDVRVLNPGLPDGTPSGNGETYDREYYDYPRPETQAAYDEMWKAAETLEGQPDRAVIQALDGNFGTALQEAHQVYTNYQQAETNYVQTAAQENAQASYEAHISQQIDNGNNVSMGDANVSNSDGSPGYGAVEIAPEDTGGDNYSDGTAYGPPAPDMTNVDGSPDVGGTQGGAQEVDSGPNYTPYDANMNGNDGYDYGEDTSSGGSSPADANMSTYDGYAVNYDY